METHKNLGVATAQLNINIMCSHSLAIKGNNNQTCTSTTWWNQQYCIKYLQKSERKLVSSTKTHCPTAHITQLSFKTFSNFTGHLSYHNTNICTSVSKTEMSKLNLHLKQAPRFSQTLFEITLVPYASFSGFHNSKYSNYMLFWFKKLRDLASVQRRFTGTCCICP